MDLSRCERLIGEEKLDKLKNSRVAVVGIGGVGSFAAEALMRSGVGHLYLIDADKVEESNSNRQIEALSSTMGRFKTEALAARFHDIDPMCDVVTRAEFYNEGDFDRFFPERYDLVVDCIDSVPSKVDLIASCVKRGIKIVSAMGGGGKIDPSLLRAADISKTSVCPLARAVRRLLRKKGIEKGVTVVFSTEETRSAQCGAKDGSQKPGTMIFVPASMGLMLASLAVRELLDI